MRRSLRSPHAHAEILAVDVEGALALPGVDCVVIGEDARRWTRPFAVAVKTPTQHWCLAVDRVRYVGEPVAVVLTRERHSAEDALERIAVRYRPLPSVVDAERVAEPDAPLLHPAVGSNIVSDRAFRRRPLSRRRIGSRSRPATREMPPARSNALS